MRVFPGSSLPYPPHVLLSENYARLVHREDLPRRLKNVLVLLEWRPEELVDANSLLNAADDTDEVDSKRESSANASASASAAVLSLSATTAAASATAFTRYVVALSLPEAEALRRLLQSAAKGGENEQLSLSRVKLALCTPDSLYLAPNPFVETVSAAATTAISALETKSTESKFGDEDIARNCLRFFDNQVCVSAIVPPLADVSLITF